MPLAAFEIAVVFLIPSENSKIVTQCSLDNGLQIHHYVKPRKQQAENNADHSDIDGMHSHRCPQVVRLIKRSLKFFGLHDLRSVGEQYAAHMTD